MLQHAADEGDLAVPLLDVAAQQAPLLPAIEKVIARLGREGAFILGPEVEAFEAEFAAHCGAAHAVGMCSGTEALHLALRALGVGPADEVIVPAFTFVATATCALLAGARPIFADVNPDTLTLAADEVERRMTPRTRAVIPVHLHGRPADLDPILDLARRKGLHVVEDACQAHGARYRGRRVGALAPAGAFSFYPTKNLGGWGDGGAVTTNDAALAAALRRLGNHGRRTPAEHAGFGITGRLDAIQAAVLRIKLPHLDRWNAERTRLAEAYRRRLAGAAAVALPPPQDAGGVWHVFIVRTPRREALQDHLRRRGVQSAPYYPIALPRQEAFRAWGHRAGDFPNAEAAAREVLALPLFPGMTDAQLDRVVEAVASF